MRSENVASLRLSDADEIASLNGPDQGKLLQKMAKHCGVDWEDIRN